MSVIVGRRRFLPGDWTFRGTAVAVSRAGSFFAATMPPAMIFDDSRFRETREVADEERTDVKTESTRLVRTRRTFVTIRFIRLCSSRGDGCSFTPRFVIPPP